LFLKKENHKIDLLKKNYEARLLFNFDNNSGFLFFFGKKMNLILTNNSNQEIIIDSNSITMPLIEGYHNQVIFFYNYIIKKYYNFFNNLVFEILEQDFKYKKENLVFCLKFLKTKLGICYYQKNKIVLNVFLIHLNLTAIKFIITHEILHLKYHKHDQLFKKNLLKKFPLNYYNIKNILDKISI